MTYESGHAIFALGAVSIALRLLYLLYLCPLCDVPGPFLARLTCLWEVASVLRGRSHDDYIKLHEMYGPVVRVGPNRVSLNGLDAADIYNKRLPKSDYYDAFGDPASPNMLTMRDDGKHVERKRKFIRCYSMTAVKGYDGEINDQTKRLLEKFWTFDAEDTIVPITHWLKLYTFGIISRITLGKDFDGLNSGSDSTGFLVAISAAVRYAAVMGLLPKLHRIMVKVMGVFGIEAPIISLLNSAERAARAYMDLRADSSKTTPHAPFLEKLFRLYDEKKTDFRAIHDCCSSNITAGSDTTAITISAALYFLHQEPSTLARLREEIDGTVKDSAFIRVDDILAMPYLMSVVQESLRLHPAVGSMLPRQIPKEGMSHAGYFFPEGTVVGVNAWAVHYNETIYGAETTKFRPERWMDRDKSPPAPLSFGVGTRRCIGEHLAVVMISKGIAEIVRNFDLEFDPSQEEYKVEGAWFVWLNYSCRLRARDKWFYARTNVTKESENNVVGL